MIKTERLFVKRRGGYASSDFLYRQRLVLRELRVRRPQGEPVQDEARRLIKPPRPRRPRPRRDAPHEAARHQNWL